MNRRSFLLAATGCAVAVPVVAEPTMDIAAGGYQSCVLWAVDLSNGEWRVVDYETFMGGKP